MTRMMLRALAVLIAVAGVIDPAIARRARMPLAVDVRLPAPSHPSFDAAEALRTGLVSTLGDDVVVDGDAPPQAIVAVGAAIVEPEAGVPVFALPLNEPVQALGIQQIEVPAWTPPP